jgi:hypothetical protein
MQWTIRLEARSEWDEIGTISRRVTGQPKLCPAFDPALPRRMQHSFLPRSRRWFRPCDSAATRSILCVRPNAG